MACGRGRPARLPQVAARRADGYTPKQPELETSARARHVAAATSRRLNEHVDRRCRHFESRTFEADVGKLLHLMAHSVYSDREVFYVS